MVYISKEAIAVSCFVQIIAE